MSTSQTVELILADHDGETHVYLDPGGDHIVTRLIARPGGHLFETTLPYGGWAWSAPFRGTARRGLLVVAGLGAVLRGRMNKIRRSGSRRAIDRDNLACTGASAPATTLGQDGMIRATRMKLAQQTVEIADGGSYTTPRGRRVDIAGTVSNCLAATRFLAPEELERRRQDVLSRTGAGFSTAFEVVNETTLAGIERSLSNVNGPVAALNFASARNPGGGFLNGSEAQEESLARSSILHASLLQASEFYRRHRASQSLLYTDAMILSPRCPIIRDDSGALLDQPRIVTFITSAAPNAGALAANRSEELPCVPRALHRRAEYVLALAASQGYRNLVLGAWGCGVFRNAPAEVAAAFAGHLLAGAWTGRFERVSFSVLDSSAAGTTITAFRDAFCNV